MLQTRSCMVPIAVSIVLGLTMARTAFGEEGPWRVAKVSGEAWISGDRVVAASTSDAGLLRAGDAIRTGRNGRVLLTRGVESILVSPNSAITLPAEGRQGRSTVVQQAGTILLDVEKKNVEHFEVETPYLAAVVKGTRFRVTLEGARARVDVVRGRVQVDDFKTGESALVLPGQSANVRMNAQEGLQLTGRGRFGPIEHGMPRVSRIAPLVVPKAGLGPAPGAAPLKPADVNGRGAATPPAPGGLIRAGNGTLRIGAPIGQVTLDVNAATQGLTRGGAGTTITPQGRSTVWSNADLNPGTDVGKNKATNSGNPVGSAEASLGTVGAARASSASVEAAAAAAAPASPASAAVAASGIGSGTSGGSNGQTIAGGSPATPGSGQVGSGAGGSGTGGTGGAGGPAAGGPGTGGAGAGGPAAGGPGRGGAGAGGPAAGGSGRGGAGGGGPAAGGPGMGGAGSGEPAGGGPGRGGAGAGGPAAGGSGMGGMGSGGPAAGGPGMGGTGAGGSAAGGSGMGGMGAGGPAAGGSGRGGAGAGGAAAGGPGMGGMGAGGPAAGGSGMGGAAAGGPGMGGMGSGGPGGFRPRM